MVDGVTGSRLGRRAGAGVAVLLRLGLPVAAFWVLSALLGLADYENGLERAVALLVLAAGLVLLPLSAGPTSRRVWLGSAVALGVLAVVLAGARVHQVQQAVAEDRVPTVDIATTTIASVELRDSGQDPYTSRIDAFGDQVRPGGTGFDHFAGFKYGPVMTWLYTPGVRGGGGSGYFVTSLAALLLLALACAAWAFRASGVVAAAGAAALMLSTAFVDGELFRVGVNDAVPMALVVAAFAARSRGGGVLAGVLLGLSFGAKLFPAALLAVPLLLAARSGRWRLVAAAAAVSALVYVPVLVRAPREVVANLVLFNLVRPGDRTGLLDGVPDALQSPLKAVLLLAVVLVLMTVGLTVPRDDDGRRAQAGLASLATLAAVLFCAQSPVLHRNYLLWIAPLFAVALAVKVWGAPPAPAVEASSEGPVTTPA